ncbi:MAG TPA: ABC transporter permease [Candidatus Acidoferrales bacterium]|nr:ABC transporter permease [Candidatus Acidoferrales bacterium]
MPARASLAFVEAVRIALDSLWVHKLRSLLTLVGVVIGVTSVIAVVSFVDGANRYVAEKVFNLGADVFLVSRAPTVISTYKQLQQAQRRRKFTLEDYRAVRDACSICEEVGAGVSRGAQVRVGNNFLTGTNVRGWTPSVVRIYDVELSSGRAFTESENEHAAPVCGVGSDIVENLFAGRDPIGQELRVDGVPCQIIGVGKKLGSVLGQSRDNWVILPITTYQRQYGTDDSVTLWFKASSASALSASEDAVRQLVRGRRHLAFGDADDFEVQTNESLLDIWANISSAFFGGTIALASISLVVGGIVIMNIMLVSVTERMREIGLRKSIGARRKDILLQFLVEASTISGVGGLLGILFGVVLAKLVSWVTPLPSSIELWPVVLGFVVSTMVGLFFGIYPASKAARLDPIEALRVE